MFQFFWSARSAMVPRNLLRTRSSEQEWLADPLAHPELRDMTQRELGDLPIGHPQSDLNCCGSC
jgi:hypothetical protein